MASGKKRRSGSGHNFDLGLYQEAGSVFVEQLNKNGFVLKNGKQPNELSKYHRVASFRSKLSVLRFARETQIPSQGETYSSNTCIIIVTFRSFN